MTTDKTSHRTTESGRAEYPHMWAITNAIFLLFATGVVLDPQPQELLAKATSSAALSIAGRNQGRGLRPTFSTKARVFTAVFVALDILLVALIWIVR